MKHPCYECGRTNTKKVAVELFDTPWNETGHVEYLCREAPRKIQANYLAESCMDLLEDTGWDDFRYFTCEYCSRLVCRQNPRNGWHSQVREVNDGEEVCLRCYQEELLANGLETEREKLEAGELPGMFFDSGNSELVEAGYHQVGEDRFIGGSAAGKAIAQEALALMDAGHKVVIGYERMAIGGLEGTVSLWAK